MKAIIITREVTLDDRRELWEWWNDPITRKMMKLNSFVPFQEHVIWFESILHSKDKKLLLSTINNQKLGVVRFDLKDKNRYEVSINLNPDFRSKGYGSKILKSSIDYFVMKTKNVNKLFAMFKKINIASEKTFKKNGFIIVENPDKNMSELKRFDNAIERYVELIINGVENA